LTSLIPTRIFLACSLLGFTACGDREGDFGRPLEQRSQPVELLLLEDGQPDPSVLADEQIVYRGNGGEPETLDPHLAQGVPASHILRDLFEGLTTESAEGDLIPGAALRWNISRDARTYTFYLRRDLTWSNGEPLTAGDFVYSLQRALNPETASSAARTLLPIQNAREVLAGELPVEELGISLLDEFSMQITLTGPTPYFLGLLASPVAYPVNRKNLEEFGDQFAKPDKLVSNGAYVLKGWTPRVSIELRKNPRFREAELTLIERVLYIPTEDRSAEVKQFRSGELDWTNEVPNNQFKWLQRHYPDELVISPWMGSYFFGFNLTQEPFIDNPSLRMALILAIDRQIITAQVTGGGETPAFTFVPPISGYAAPLPDWVSWPRARQLEEARRLYAQAGYGPQQQLDVEIRYNTNDNHRQMALAIAAMWKQELGVRARLVNQESKVFYESRRRRVDTEVFRAAWIGDFRDPVNFLDIFHSSNGQNDTGFAAATYDRLLEQAARETDTQVRLEILGLAESEMMEHQPVLPIYFYVSRRLVKPGVRGWQPNLLDFHPTRYMTIADD